MLVIKLILGLPEFHLKGFGRIGLENRLLSESCCALSLISSLQNARDAVYWNSFLTFLKD
jgi:hypothetical protein